jgi:hypothetical protein
VSLAADYLARRSATTAYVLEIEGIDSAFTTVRPAVLGDAWTASGRTLRGGLDLPGSIQRSVDLLQFALEPTSLSINLVEGRGTYLADVFADAAPGPRTNLSGPIDRDDLTIPVITTAGFPASGVIHIGCERIEYTGTVANAFTGCTRGTMPWVGSWWPHSFDHGTSAWGAEVTSRPAKWKGRGVALYLTARDPTSGAWCTRADSEIVFAGLLDGWNYDGKGTFTLAATSVEKMTEAVLLRDQMVGTVGGIMVPYAETIEAEEIQEGTVAQHKIATITVLPGTYTLEKLRATVNDLLVAEKTAGNLTHAWDVRYAPEHGAMRTSMLVTTAAAETGTGTLTCTLRSTSAHQSVAWAALGGAPVREEFVNGIGGARRLVMGAPVTITNTVDTAAGVVAQAHATFPGPSLTTCAQWAADLPLVITGGQWHSQPLFTLPPVDGASGFLLVGDSDLWLVKYTAGTFTRLARWSLDFTQGMHPIPQYSDPIIVREGDDVETIEVKQVWLAYGKLHDLVASMLTSTGTAGGYNGADDSWPATIGCGIPAALLDKNSLQSVTAALGGAGDTCTWIDKPTPAADLINSYCACLGWYLVWRRGKLTAITPMTIESRVPDWSLTVSNALDFMATSDGSDLIRNRATLRYNVGTDGEYANEETVENLPSIDDYGPSADLVYDASFLFDHIGYRIDAWRTNVAAAMLAYWGKAIRRHRVTVGPSLAVMSVGDIVGVTYPDPPNPQTGVYGLSNAKGWIWSFAFDPASQTGEAEIVTPLGFAYQLGPSAMLDYSRGDKGYLASGPYLYLRSHEFSAATEAVDASHFRVGDSIRIVEVDPANPASYLVWTKTATAVDAASNRLTLSTAMSSPVFDGTKRYYVELGLYANVIAGVPSRAQGGADAYSAIADDADMLVSNLVGPYQWGLFSDNLVSQAASTTTLFRRPRTIGDDSEGRPWSVFKIRDAARNCNVLWAYVTGQQVIADPTVDERSVADEAYKLISGPHAFHVPPGVTAIVVHLTMRASAGATAYFRVTASPSFPRGSATVPVFPPDSSQVETSKASATQSILTATVPLSVGPGGYCYVTVEARGAAQGQTAYLHGVSAYCYPRSL